MKQQYALTILYDLASTIGGEVSLAPLLTNTLQRIMHHTGVPCGMVLLNDFTASSDQPRLTLESSVGDRMLIKALGQEINLDRQLTESTKFEHFTDTSLIHTLPCRQDKYRSLFLLPIPGEGRIILLCDRQAPDSPVPMEQLFPPLMSNLAKSIHLCRVNDRQKELLKQVVSERTGQLREAMDTIDEQRKSLQAILNHAPVGIWMVGPDSKIKFVNPPLCQALGKNEEEIMASRSYEAIFPDEIAGEQRNTDLHCLREKQEVASRTEIKDSDGKVRTFDVIRSPILNDDNEPVGLVGMAIDISDRLQAEAEKELMQKRIEHTQRLESLGVLAGGIAHDFNNILAAIMGNAEMAKQHAQSEPARQNHIGAIIKASQSAADLCGQMLAYSGKGEFVIKPISLSETVNHMTQLLKVSISKQVSLQYHLDDNIPAINADISQIQQIIMNLLTNANEAIGTSPGTITISTGTQMVDDDYLVGAYLPDTIEPGRYAFVEVSDNGCGMDQETLSRLFDPFFTTKFTGRGLGMSAVIGIIRGHKGTIKVYSEPGKGTSFKVLIPVSEEKAIPLIEAELDEENWQGKGTILVVDDDPMVLKIAEAVMKAIGFETLGAADGVEALEIYRKHQNDISAVFLDMTMPRMGGKETFAELRKIDPEVKVVLTSGYNEQSAVQEFTGKGLAGFMQKPYRVTELRRKMREVLSG